MISYTEPKTLPFIHSHGAIWARVHWLITTPFSFYILLRTLTFAWLSINEEVFPLFSSKKLYIWNKLECVIFSSCSQLRHNSWWGEEIYLLVIRLKQLWPSIIPQVLESEQGQMVDIVVIRVICHSNPEIDDFPWNVFRHISWLDNRGQSIVFVQAPRVVLNQGKLWILNMISK